MNRLIPNNLSEQVDNGVNSLKSRIQDKKKNAEEEIIALERRRKTAAALMLNDLHISVQTLIDRNNIAVHRESSYPANRFCHCLERILVYGLKKTWLGNKPSFFDFIMAGSIESEDLRLRHATNKAKSISQLHNDGKGRAFFRQALNEKQIPVYITELVKNTVFVSNWYHPWGVLGNNRQLETLKATLEDLDLVKSEFKMLLNDKKVNILTLWEFNLDDIPEWSDDAERGSKKRKETVVATCPEDEVISSLPIEDTMVMKSHGKRKKKKKKRKRKNIQIVQSDDPSLYAQNETEKKKKKKKKKEKKKKAAKEVKAKAEPVVHVVEKKRERVEISTGAVDEHALASQIPDTFIDNSINEKIIIEDLDDDDDFVPTLDEEEEDLVKLALSTNVPQVTLASIFENKEVEKTSYCHPDQLGNESKNNTHEIKNTLHSPTKNNNNNFKDNESLGGEDNVSMFTTSPNQRRGVMSSYNVSPSTIDESFSKKTMTSSTREKSPSREENNRLFSKSTTSPGGRRGGMSSGIYKNPKDVFKQSTTSPKNNKNKHIKIKSVPIERPINYKKHKNLSSPPQKSEKKQSPRHISPRTSPRHKSIKPKHHDEQNLENIPAEKIDLSVPVVFIPNPRLTPSRSSSIEPMESSPLSTTSPHHKYEPSSLYHNSSHGSQHEIKKDPATAVISEIPNNFSSSSQINEMPEAIDNSTEFRRPRHSTVEKYDDDFNDFDEWNDSDDPSEEPPPQQEISFPGQAVRATLRANTKQKFNTVVEWQCNPLPKRNDNKQIQLQENLCGSCGKMLEYNFLNRARFHYCRYLGSLHCDSCHHLKRHVVPWRVLYRCDTRPRKVCDHAYYYLQKVYNIHFLPLTIFNEEMLKNQNLKDFHSLVKRLSTTNHFIETCRDKKRLLNLVHPYRHLFRELFSLEDVTNAINKNLLYDLRNIYKQIEQHIKFDCELCQSRGHYCELCGDPTVIYAFDFENVVQCSLCAGVFHKQCFDFLNCPKCIRKQRHSSVVNTKIEI